VVSQDHPPYAAVALRRGVLAVSVLDDIDVEPGSLGVVLPGPPPLELTWDEVAAATGARHPETDAGRQRLRWWLRSRRRAADLVPLEPRLRAVGLPVGHLLHPGGPWVCERVLGGALELGLGVLGLDPDDPDAVVALPPPALQHAGVDPARAWPAARTLLEAVGLLAASLLARDAKGVLRPVGDADVVTLLGARSLRACLAGPDGGMVGAVVPMRRRGWTRLSLVDPAFGPAAAAATPAAERGFARPLLLTADEVVLVEPGGHPGIALRQAVGDDPRWGRDVLRR